MYVRPRCTLLIVRRLRCWGEVSAGCVVTVAVEYRIAFTAKLSIGRHLSSSSLTIH